MAEVEDLSTTDASNTARFPESQAPSSVNNGARALEGLLARHFADTSAGMLATATSTTAYTIASNKTVSSYTDGLTIRAQIHATSTGNCTLNVDSVGAQNIVWNDGSQTQLTTGDLVADQVVTFVYDLGNTVWVVQTPLNDEGNFLTASSTATLTNKTFDANGTGNSLSNVDTADATSVTGADTNFVTGTAGTNGNVVAWNADGDAVDGSMSATPATQAQQETATSTTVAVTPGRQQFHPSAAKGWVNFAVDGTDNASYNVTSITDTGTGDWTVNWATDFSGANYCAQVTLEMSANSALFHASETHAAGTTQCITYVSSSSHDETSLTAVHCSAFGDQ